MSFLLKNNDALNGQIYFPLHFRKIPVATTGNARRYATKALQKKQKQYGLNAKGGKTASKRWLLAR